MNDAPLVQRGVHLIELGRYAEAEQHLRQALVERPDDAGVLVLLGRSLHGQERYAEARDAVLRALAEAPDHVVGFLVLSAAYAGLEQLDAALDAVRSGLRVAPHVPALHRQEGAVLLAQQRAHEALGSLERARRLAPNDADTIATLGAALWQLRQYAEAERAVDDALRLDPENVEAHRLRGLLELRRGGGRGAVEAHRTALRLDPHDRSSREALATALKTRNPVYGQLLRFSLWMEGLPSGARWAIILAPFFGSRLLRPFDEHVWAQVALGLLIAAVVITWAAEPSMNALLLCSRFARQLLPVADKRAAYAFLAYLGAALASVGVGFAASSDRALFFALVLGIWSVSAGQTHLVDDSRIRAALVLQGAGALLAVLTAVMLALGVGAGGSLMVLLFFLGIGALWFTALA